MEELVGFPGAVCAVERRAVLDRDEHVLEPVALGTVVVDVARRDDAEPEAARESSERLVSGRISSDGIVLQLYEDAPGPERGDEAVRQLLGFGHRRFER